MFKENYTFKMFNPDFQKIQDLFLGWDEVWNTVDKISAGLTNHNYPPTNIKKVDKDGFKGYVMEFAVAGFSKDDLTVRHLKKEKRLEIKGTKTKEDAQDFVRHSIAGRDFEVQYGVENLKVKRVGLKNGILTVELLEVKPPEEEVEDIEIK